MSVCGLLSSYIAEMFKVKRPFLLLLQVIVLDMTGS